MTEENKPFSKSYVLRTTAKHMRKNIDISIRKTFERIKEFEGNVEKNHELFETLAVLHKMRKDLDAFQKAYQSDFKES
jgi:hypothetical protein